MNTRQQDIFKYIVEGYINTAQPVASKALSQRSKLHASPATIRNDMAKLENDDLIYQPHTSAGRIPTLTGLRYYIDNLLKPSALKPKDQTIFEKIYKTSGLKGVARQAAAYCHSAIIITHGDSEIYYTGFSYLFSQPEFADQSMIQSISAAVDKFESVLHIFLKQDTAEFPKIFIGSDNPLGSDCSAIFISNKKQAKTQFGILNPLRTDYPRHIGLLQSINKYL